MGIEPVEAEPHLRAVLESQPVVLARVSKDGTFLAINEAGLSMLGATALEQILGITLTSLVPSEEHKACQAFLDRAMGGQRGSFEADLVGLTGSRHTFELHGSAHPGAPDGIASVLLSFRDVTESRRLEHSLVEAATRQAEQEAAHDAERLRLMAELEQARKAQTDQFAVDEQLTDLERRLAESGDEHAALQQAHAEEIARLQEAIVEARRVADSQSAAFAQLDGTDQQLAELRSRYDALDSERQQLLDTAGLLRSEAEARQQTVFELTERLEGLEGERQHAVDTANTLRLDLDERHALVGDLTTRLQVLEAEQQQAAEAMAQLHRELESRTALANELAARIETLEAELVSLRAAAEAQLAALRSSTDAEHAAIRTQAEEEKAQLREAAEAERGTLQSAFDQERLSWRSSADTELSSVRAALQQEHASSRAEIESALQQLQASYNTDTGALRDALNESLTEQARLAEATAAAEEAAGQKGAQVAALEQTLSNERSAHAGRLAELEAALVQAVARADEALGAVQRAEDAFGSERARLEDALLAAVDAERAAKSALSNEIASRTLAERSHRQMQQAIERFAKDAGIAITGGGGGSVAPAPAKVTTSTKALSERLNSELPRRFGDGLTLQLLAASADVSIAVDENVAVNAIGAFADSRRTSMLGGQVTVEISQVFIDQGVGRIRGMAPGAYVLVAMNVDGQGAQQGVPQEIFDSADLRAWREVKDELQTARTAILGAGGQIWLTREGASIMIVEFYLPREGAR